jgi:hypothetical protein
MASTLPYVELLAVEQGDKQTIPFLFDKTGSRPVFQKAIKDIPEMAKATKAGPESARNFSIIFEGNRFLGELQDVGVLHETRGAPLGVQAKS